MPQVKDGRPSERCAPCITRCNDPPLRFEDLRADFHRTAKKKYFVYFSTASSKYAYCQLENE